jgi:hypothetical protein
MKQAANIGLFLDLLFDSEDGCDNFLERACSLSLDYIASYPRRQNCST